MKGFRFELAAEQRADPRAGEPDRIAGAAVERQNEGVAQHAADGAGFDVGALGRRAGAAPFLPIGVKLAAGRMFHGRTRPSTADVFAATVPERDGGSQRSACGRHGADGVPQPAVAVASRRQGSIKLNETLTLAAPAPPPKVGASEFQAPHDTSGGIFDHGRRWDVTDAERPGTGRSIRGRGRPGSSASRAEKAHASKREACGSPFCFVRGRRRPAEPLAVAAAAAYLGGTSGAIPGDASAQSRCSMCRRSWSRRWRCWCSCMRCACSS